MYTHAQRRGSFAQAWRGDATNRGGRRGPHGQDKSQSRVCHRSRASAWAQPWGVTSERIARDSKVASVGAPQFETNSYGVLGERAAGCGPSEIAQHRISMCPPACPCLLSPRALLRVVQSTLGHRAPHTSCCMRATYMKRSCGPVKIEFCCNGGCLFSPRARRRAAGARTRRGRRMSSHKIFHTKPLCRIGARRIRWAMRGDRAVRTRRAAAQTAHVAARRGARGRA